MGRSKEAFPAKVEPLLSRAQWDAAEEDARQSRAAVSAWLAGEIRVILHERSKAKEAAAGRHAVPSVA